MLFAKRSKKGNPVAKADEMKELPVAKSKSGGIPLDIKATLNGAKKAPSISAKMGENAQASVKSPVAAPMESAKDPGHSDAYLERMKKRNLK